MVESTCDRRKNVFLIRWRQRQRLTLANWGARLSLHMLKRSVASLSLSSNARIVLKKVRSWTEWTENQS